MKIITLVGVPGSMPRTRGTILRSTDDTLMSGNQWYVQARSIDSRQGRFGDSIISCIIFNKIVNCKLFTLETLKSSRKLVKWVRAFQIQLEFGSVGFWAEGKTEVPGEKTSKSKEENQQQTQPKYIDTVLYWWLGRRVLTLLRNPWRANIIIPHLELTCICLADCQLTWPQRED